MKQLLTILIAILVICPAAGQAAKSKENYTEDFGNETFTAGPDSYGGAMHDYGTPMMTHLNSVVDQYLRHKKQLGLTPEQMTALKELRQNYQRVIIQLNADLDQAQMDLNNLLNEDDVDMTRVQAENASIEKLQTEIRTKNIDLFVAAQKLLKPAQVDLAEKLGIERSPSAYFGRHMSAGY